MSSATPIICPACGRAAPDDARFCPGCGARIDASAKDPWLGTVIGERYRLVERLGNGRTGAIYKAEHVTLHRKAAVKILHSALTPDSAGMDRFSREARVLSEMDNEHLVSVTDFGKTPGGQLYLAMELLEGETLSVVMRRHGRLSVERTVALLAQVAEGLMEAHAMGYVHRDLRPANLFLIKRRGRELLKILGFGVVKLIDGDNASLAGASVADPTYMSPEQARGEAVDGRSDLYSLAVIGYEMLVGAPPFSGPDVGRIVRQHLEEPPAPPSRLRPELPAPVEAALLQALSKRPEDRFATMLRFVEALGQTPQPVPAVKVRPPAQVIARASAPNRVVTASPPFEQAAARAPAVMSTVIVSPSHPTPIDARMPTPGPGTMEAPVSHLPHMPSGPVVRPARPALDQPMPTPGLGTMQAPSQSGIWFAAGDEIDRLASQRADPEEQESTLQIAAGFVRRRRWLLYVGVAVSSLLITLVVGAVVHRCSGPESGAPPAAARQ